MADTLDKLASAIDTQGELPPLHLWNPPLSGDIDMMIRANGEWLHEGAAVQRKSLVKLFSSILRREDDGEYYLVTPVEKWRIQVEDLPLVVVDFDFVGRGSDQQTLVVTTNVDRVYTVSERYPLVSEPTTRDNSEGREGDIPAVVLDNNLRARFTRSAYYRLIEAARQVDNTLELVSDGQRFVIGRW